MGLLGCKLIPACPSIQHPVTTSHPPSTLTGAAAPDVLLAGSHCQAQCCREREDITLTLRGGGGGGGRENIRISACPCSVAFLCLRGYQMNFTHCTLYTSSRRAAYQCETHSFHVCMWSYSDSIINLDRKGDLLFKPHLFFWEEKEIASYVSKKDPRWLGEPQLQHTVVTLWNTFPLNPLPSAVSSVLSYLAHRQESSAQRTTAKGTM